MSSQNDSQATVSRGRLMTGLPARLEDLLHPRAYPHPTQAVELVETHISWILLTGQFAYKIKRPVHFPFVDLRSCRRRAFLCQEEVRLNGRFAPEIYLGVARITSSEGQLRLDGHGRVIEHAVKMRQFPTAAELDRLLENGDIGPNELEAFGHDLARIHVDLPVAGPTQAWGRPTAIRTVIFDNHKECAQAAKAFAGSADVQELRTLLESRLEAAVPMMATRFAGGCVRECHGDLHARNIVRWGSRLLAFDCLEFEPAFRWIDVADEIAFLLADLRARHRSTHAHAFLSGYLTYAGDFQACRLLDLYQAHRSLVLAKVIALSAAARGRSGTEASPARRHFEEYLDCARQSLSRKQPILVLMSGLSGSGKTWLAKHLAPLLGAVHLRSDVERKRLARMAMLDRSNSALGQGLYSGQENLRVYQHLARCAEDALSGGYTAIVDATFLRCSDRTQFHDLSVQLGVPSCIVHCQAPPQILRTRIAARSQDGNDPSEADLAVLHWQETHCEPLTAEESFVVLPAITTDENVVNTLSRQIAAVSDLAAA